MKVLNAKVNWYNGYGNLPALEILVDKIPDMNKLRFSQKGNHYYAELNGYVRFFYSDGPDVGYGGSHFNITMENKEHKTLVGPWSSNSRALNEAGFKECTEVSITDELRVFNKGFTYMSGAVTVELAKKIMAEFLPELYLIKTEDAWWCPSLNKDRLIKGVN